MVDATFVCINYHLFVAGLDGIEEQFFNQSAIFFIRQIL